jgi:hypothetical protein
MNDHTSGIDYRTYFDILLEEYKAIRDASIAMEGKLSTLQSIMVTVFAGAIAFFSLPVTVDIYYLLLVASIIFSALGLAISFTFKQVYMLTLYETKVLRPRIQGLLQTQLKDDTISVLEWQQFYQKSLSKSGWLNQAVSVIQGIGNVLFPIGASIGPIIAGVWMKELCGSGWSSAETTLLIVGAVFASLMLLSFLVGAVSHWLERIRPHQKTGLRELQPSTREEDQPKLQ